MTLTRWDSPKQSEVYISLLYYPADSELAHELVWWSRKQEYIPRWLPRADRSLLGLKRLLGWRIDAANRPWASIGPKLFTYLCKKYTLFDLVSPSERFCPVPYEDKIEPFMAEGNPERFITSTTDGVHLWYQGMRGGPSGRNRLDKQHWPFEKHSFIWKMAIELGLSRTWKWQL